MSEKEKMRTSIREAPKPEYVKVDSLKPRRRNLNVVVKIVSKGQTREITSRRDYTVHSVAEALAGHETGCVVLTLWDQQIGEFDENDVETPRMYSRNGKNMKILAKRSLNRMRRYEKIS